MFKLTSQNLRELGGPMGSERVTINYVRIYNRATTAISVAEGDYGQEIKWIETKNGWRSPDLGYVMYRIERIEVDD